MNFLERDFRILDSKIAIGRFGSQQYARENIDLKWWLTSHRLQEWQIWGILTTRLLPSLSYLLNLEIINSNEISSQKPLKDLYGHELNLRRLLSMLTYTEYIWGYLWTDVDITLVWKLMLLDQLVVKSWSLFFFFYRKENLVSQILIVEVLTLWDFVILNHLIKYKKFD